MHKPQINRTASHLLRQYGAEAADMAAENLEWSLAHNDVKEASFWKDVMAAIRRIELTAGKQGKAGETVSAIPAHD